MKIFTHKLFWLGTFVLWFNLFLFRPVGPRAMGLVWAGLWVLLLTAFYNQKFYLRAWKMLGGLSLVGLSLVVMITARDSHFVLFILSLSQLGLLSLLHYSLSNQICELHSLLELLMAPVLTAANYLKNAILLLFTKDIDLGKQRIWSGSHADKKNTWKTLGGGLIVGLPIAFILIILLSSADPIFAQTVQDFFDKIFQWDRWSIRLVVSLALALVLLPAIVSGHIKKFTSPLNYLKNWSYSHNYLVVMAMVAAVMSAFLIIQWPYVFASVPAETDLSQFGIATYSEYVTKGFMEFLLVAGMIYVLVWVGLVNLRLDQRRSGFNWLKWMQMAVLGLLTIFLTSVFRRIWLYQLYHGLSLIRFYGGWFLAIMSLLTLTLALRHWWQGKWVRWEMAIVAVMLLSFGITNVENLIATTDPPTVNGQVDHLYLVRMSADGYQGWLQAYNYAQQILDQEYPGMIGTDQRREIAYAGFVIERLLENYQRLVNDYGSAEEIRAYYTSQLQSDESISQMTIADWEARHGLNDPVSIENFINQHADGQQIGIRNYLGREAMFQSQIGKIASADDNIPSADLYKYQSAARFLTGIFTDQCTDTNAICARLSGSVDWAVYDLRFKKLKDLDRWLGGNNSAEKIYLRIKSDMPLAQLQKLERKFYELRTRILNQPQTGRSFEIDVSLETPLLF